VCVRYQAGSGEARECTLLEQKSAELRLTKASGCPGWVEANDGANGYYRVLYQGDLLGDLLKNVAQELSLPEKVALIGDLAALTRNGKITLGRALPLAPSFAQNSARQVVTKTMEITTGLQDNLGSTKFTGGPRILAQVLEGIDLCIAYKNAQEASVTEFLKSYKPAASASSR